MALGKQGLLTMADVGVRPMRSSISLVDSISGGQFTPVRLKAAWFCCVRCCCCGCCVC